MNILNRLDELEARLDALESDNPDFKYSRDKSNVSNQSIDISILKDIIGIEGVKYNHEL